MFCHTLLAERLRLESNMQSMCPRFILFCMMMTLLGVSLLGPNITELGTVNHLLVHAFRLENINDEIRTTEDVREFIDNFAETAASFYPVNFQYVPDPELMRITQGIRQYQEGPSSNPPPPPPTSPNACSTLGWRHGGDWYGRGSY